MVKTDENNVIRVFSATLAYNSVPVIFHFSFNGTENNPIYKVHCQEGNLAFLMVKNADRFEIVPLLPTTDSLKKMEKDLSDVILKKLNNYKSVI